MSNEKLSEAQYKELENIYDELIGDSLGVFQAVGNLVKELNTLKDHLKAGKYMEASSLGYKEIATEFILL
jgi:hypothetical protein